MNNDNIRPEWIPSGYADKPHSNPVIEVHEVKYALYYRKTAVFKLGFKRRVIK